jgi:hypothetical protein
MGMGLFGSTQLQVGCYCRCDVSGVLLRRAGAVLGAVGRMAGAGGGVRIVWRGEAHKGVRPAEQS